VVTDSSKNVIDPIRNPTASGGMLIDRDNPFEVAVKKLSDLGWHDVLLAPPASGYPRVRIDKEIACVQSFLLLLPEHLIQVNPE